MALVWGIVSSSKSFRTAGTLSFVSTRFSGRGKGFAPKQARLSAASRPSSATKVVGRAARPVLSKRSSYMSCAFSALRLKTLFSAILCALLPP